MNFWKWLFNNPDPVAGEMWRAKDGNPFDLRTAYIVAVKEGWVHYTVNVRHAGSDYVSKFDNTFPLSTFKANYRRS